MEELHAQGSKHQLEFFGEFSSSHQAPTVIPAILEAIDSEAPQLDNNGCLLLSMILEAHPETECRIEPLLRAIERKNSKN